MLRIDDCDFDPLSGALRRAGTDIPLEPQPAAVLAALARRPGELVTHQELRDAIWGTTTHVSFQENLHYCVRQIRQAFGDDAKAPRFVATVPRRGYRLIAPVTVVSLPPPASPDARHTSARTWLVRATVAAAIVAAITIVERRPNRHHEIAVNLLQSLHDLVY
jgi:DNA-binding winged helix-turn-helix (wHTH) protein